VASNITAELDKTFHSTVKDPVDDDGTYGQMNIRVVVLKKRKNEDTGEDATAELKSEEVLPSSTKKEIDTYLEDPKRGKECCVFLINGQRQDSWDNTFIIRDLGLKYLRNRMLIIVDLDGLKPEAIAEIMQGSRQGFFQGKVFHAISKRLLATLKKDPDLDKLQKEAEQKLLEMKAADAGVKDKLDQLIEGHHAAAMADGPGEGDGIADAGDGRQFTEVTNRHDVVVMGSPNVGQEAALPVLATEPAMVALRLHPDETRVVNVTSLPQRDWVNVEQLRAQLQPEVKGLSLALAQGAGNAALTLAFTEPDDMDDEEYPVNTDLVVYARFKGHADTRMLKLPVVVVPPRTKKTRTPRPLLAKPTFLRVVSRQPVKLLPGGPSVHVKLVWDGQDSLLVGSPPAWIIGARCETLGTFPQIGLGNRGGGKLELLLDTPHGILTDTELDFEVEATGPDNKKLTTKFKAVVIDQETDNAPCGPRRISSQAPDSGGQRRPPYQLVYINEEKWKDVGCWEDQPWTGADVGCFQEPTEAAPLILVLNEDFGLIRKYCDGLVERQLEEATINERKSRYYSHVAFHLYQMYGDYRKMMDASGTDEGIKPPTPEELRNEVNRVGTTLAKLMEVSR
jgi:hypothetical protein